MDNINNNDNNYNDIAYYKSSYIFLYLWIIFLNFMIMGKENDNIYVVIIIDLILSSFMIYCWGLACTYLIFFFEILIYRFICNFFSILE